MIIRSPKNSFVNFNPEYLDCSALDTRQSALPVYDNFGIKFQFLLEDRVSSGSVFKAAVCSADCELLYNPNYTAIKICDRFVFTYNSGIDILTSADFPILVGNYTPDPGQPQIPAGTYTEIEFIDIINDLYETTLPGIDSINCCDDPYPVMSGIVVFINGNAEEITLSEYYSRAWVDFPPTAMGGTVQVGDCFRYCITTEANEVIACSNLFTRVQDECYTTLFRYYNEENGFGFKYLAVDVDGETVITENTIRLYVNFRNQQPANLQENTSRLPNGTYQRTSTIYDWQYTAQVAPLSDEQYRQLTALLKHDKVFATEYLTGIDGKITALGVPEIDYPDRIRKPTNPGTFTIIDESAGETNNNCGSSCGIELVESCAGGGQVVIPCPEKFNDELVVGQAVGKYPMADGQTVYSAPELAGSLSVMVFREGLLQYKNGDGYIISYPVGSTNITFTPAVQANERIAIWQE